MNVLPRVSVVVPFFNTELFLEEAIRSVVGQTMSDFELLLCDDGSSDGSTAIARAWAARDPLRITYLEHANHANEGASPTRNYGIRAARGEFVAFLDADDVWHPHKLAEQVRILEEYPDLGMVCGTARYWQSWAGGVDTFVASGHVRNRVVRPPEASLNVYPLGRASAPCPSDLLLRREVIERIGGFEEQFVGARQLYEDQAFLSKLYLTSPVFFSDAVWLDYREHPDSCVATVVRDGRYDEVRSYFLMWFEEYLRRLPEPPPKAVERAVARALRPYRHPLLHRLVALPARIAVGGRRMLGRLKRRFAPAA